ncbi:MAG: hypothetical protein ACRC31_08115 [Cetobacterium sp.]
MKILLLIMVLITSSCSVKSKHWIKYPNHTELKKGLDLALKKLNLQDQSFKQFQAQYNKDVTEIRQEYILELGNIKHYIDIKFDEVKNDLNVKTLSLSNVIKQEAGQLIYQNATSTKDITDLIKESVIVQRKIQYEYMEYFNGVVANQNNDKQHLYTLLAEIRNDVFKLIEIYNHEKDNTYHLKMNDGQFKKFLEYWKEWEHINKD